MPHDDDLLPLSPLSLAILLALAEGAMHGYALLQAVERQAQGQVRVGTGSLYAALQRLEGDGLVTEAPEAAPEGGDARRRYYRLTDRGRAVGRAELVRLSRVLAGGGARRLAPELVPAGEGRA